MLLGIKYYLISFCNFCCLFMSQWYFYKNMSSIAQSVYFTFLKKHYMFFNQNFMDVYFRINI